MDRPVFTASPVVVTCEHARRETSVQRRTTRRESLALAEELLQFGEVGLGRGLRPATAAEPET